MGHFAIVLWLFVAWCLLLHGTALTIEPMENSIIIEAQGFLSRSVQLTNKSFCFFVTSAQDFSKDDDFRTLCSFDGGATVKEAKTTHRICTNGVVVDQRLICPHEEFPHDEDGGLEFTSVAYAVHDGEMKEVESEKRFLFISGKQTGEVRRVLFNGNSIHLDDDEDVHVLVSTIINDAEERKVVVFKSENGFTFKAVAVVPGVEDADEHYLLSEGGRRLTLVSAHTNAYYTSASSGHSGNFWSTPKALNVTAPPTSAAFSSGALVEYACSNETSTTAKWYLAVDNAKRPLTPEAPNSPVWREAGGSPLLFFSVASADNSRKLVVVHSGTESEEPTGVRISLYNVDDSTEAKEKADRIAKEREELLKKEAARFKAKLERLEREKAQRREQRRKELERKQKFLVDDEPNVRSAKSYMNVDGEMIIIRRVRAESVALEKEVFFSDL